MKGLNQAQRDLIQSYHLDKTPDKTFNKFCDNHIEVFGDKGTPQRRRAQKQYNNLKKRNESFQMMSKFSNADLSRTVIVFDLSQALAVYSNSTGSDYPKQDSEEWAITNPNIAVFTLDLDLPYNNEYVQPMVATGVVVDHKVVVDKLIVFLPVIDVQDLMDDKYEASLEAEGKGIFVKMPSIPHYFYKDVEIIYRGEKDEEDEEDEEADELDWQNPDFKAASIHSVKLCEDSRLASRTIYFKFPANIICSSDHFNDVTGDKNKLKTQFEPPLYRALPKAFHDKRAKAQLMLRVKWEVTIASSVQKVSKGKGSTTLDQMEAAFGKMNLRRGKRGKSRNSSMDEDDSD
jgi:hypothetical protein